VPHKGNDSLEGKHVVQDLESLIDLHAFGVMGNLTAVLVMHAKMRASGLGSLLRIFGFNTVSDHFSEGRKKNYIKSDTIPMHAGNTLQR
jgi:hypothetical protein